MAILAGIDEAGLGPLLGPLVVTGAAFRVPDDQLDRCLWQTLRLSCASSMARAGRRLVVADSKRLYRSRNGGADLGRLEHSALVMLGLGGEPPGNWRALLHRIAPGAADELDRYAWYSASNVALPISEGMGDLPTQVNAVRLDCAAQGVSLHGVFCEPLLEGSFNDLVTKTRNKGTVSLGLVFRVIDRVMGSATGERLRICVDRQGGRIRYRDALTTAFPGHELTILDETPARSAYRMTAKARICEIDFVTRGENRHFLVALASIFSKYVRELYMHAFNEYWRREVGDIRPTAGYYTDARRWLSDMSAELERRSIDRDTLVRQR